MEQLYSTMKRTIVLTLIIGNSLLASSQDLPGASASMQTAPIGSLVIAMDNSNQATSSINASTGTYFFNLRAYGLAILFRNAGITIRWVINSTKAQDGIDFSATAERMYPSYVAPQSLDFRAGPFVIFPSDTLGADYLINWFNYSVPDSGKVKVYRLTQDVDVDVRYSLSTPPRIGILHDSCDIHENFMGMASVPTVNYNCLPNASGLISGCYTMVTMPHMVPGNLTTWDDDSVYNFVMAGGNMLGECESVQTFENATKYHSTTGTLANITGGQLQNFNNNVYYDNPAMAYGQFHGTARPRTRGALQVWRYSSSTINNFYSIVSCKRNATDNLHYLATVSKMRSGLGGLAFFLGNHEYYTYDCHTCVSGAVQNEQEINGIRMYLNAIMMPTEIIPCVILDVKLGDFTATKQGDKSVLLKWNTFSETDNSYFLIEHSVDGKNFKGIGKRLSKGNTGDGHQYDYNHGEPVSGTNFYRLKMVGANGKAEHSSVRRVVFGKDRYTMSLFPNPAKNKATLMIEEKDGEELSVRIFDGAGRMVMQQLAIVKGQQSQLILEKLQPGVYAVIAVNNDGEQFNSKLVIAQ